ncbi:MAG: glutamate--tRNA ligase [Legionellales bacterium]|nr:glutamate--tRNA ligase [Legionellales bacterium]OUX68243.1 MAG: glutamate--tRNA ligase [bacterium TMED178]
MSSKPVRVRFAPSPTGSMHVGGVRTALYNYLFAKHHCGQLVLRVEDTDETRSTEASQKEQLDDLKWLGLAWDEGPDIGGPYAPYKQSQRTEAYKAYADQLLQAGKAYYCFMTDEEMDAQRAQAEQSNQPYQIISPYREVGIDEAQKRIKAGEKPTIRFKVSDLPEYFSFEDAVRGEITLPSHMVGDFIIMRSDGMPVYNFCCVVDDHEMAITHVFRGEEHLPNTLRQLMLYESFSWNAPVFGHLSIILDEHKKKLSKRHDAASCSDLKASGYIPEAILNYLALLGWSHPRGEEILSLSDLIETFSISRVHASAAVFDVAKLRWLNGQHVRHMDIDHLWSLCQPLLAQEGVHLPDDDQWYQRGLPVALSEFFTLNDGVAFMKRWFNESDFKIEPGHESILKADHVPDLIRMWLKGLPNSQYIGLEEYQVLVNDIKKNLKVKGKMLFAPLRIAMIGLPDGPDLSLLAQAIPTEMLKDRAYQCLKYVESH